MQQIFLLKQLLHEAQLLHRAHTALLSDARHMSRVPDNRCPDKAKGNSGGV